MSLQQHEEPEGLFGRLSDEEVLGIFVKLNEQDQLACSGVCRRWRNLAQDPQLIRHSVQVWKDIKELFNANLAKFVDGIDCLRNVLKGSDNEALHELADDENALLAMPKRIEHFQVVQAIDELISSYLSNLTTREQQVRTMKQRDQLRQQIADRTVKLWGHIKNDDQVHAVNYNPFWVSVPVKAWILEPLHQIINELAIPDEAFPEVVVREEPG